MGKRIKKILNILFTIIFVLGLSACTEKNSKANQDMEIVDTKSLINNIIKTQEKDEKKAETKKSAEKDHKESSKKTSKKEEEEKNEEESLSKSEDTSKKVSKKKSKGEVKTVKIKAFGDILAHMGQVSYAKNKSGGETYDFSEQFAYMEDFIKDSDLSIGNFETSINPDYELSGYPMFNSPESYPEYIKKAGFDIVTTANNHSLDTGEDGLFTTIEAIEKAGLDHVGTQKENEDRIIYKTVNDVKIAFLAYTYGANGLEGNVVNHDVNKIVNFLDEDLIEKDIKVAKNNNADFIVVYPHWGVEYQSYPSPEQISLGRKMIDWGADLVIGNHPHVVQPGEYYESEDGRKGFIAYALGNFISRQSLETLGDIRTEQSVAYEINLSKDTSDGETKIDGVKAYPLWTGTSYNEYGGNTQTRLVADFLDDGKYKDQADEFQKDRMRQAQDMVSETVTTDVEYRK